MGKLSAALGWLLAPIAGLAPRSQRCRPGSPWQGASRALPERQEGRRKPASFSWKQIERAKQLLGMGLILADLLLMLSHGETVKTRAGDVEIDAHQNKLSLRVDALTSAARRL